jgi:hypothetical protein
MSAPAEMPVVRLSSPGDIVSALPHLCGFVPTESLVAVSLRGERRRIGLTLRFDLPDGADEEAADQVAARLAHDGASAAVVVVYTEATGDLPRAGLVELLLARLRLRGITVMEALLVRDARWSSYTCQQVRCCPSEGTPLQPALDAIAAATVLDGRAVLTDRAALVASLAPPALLAARAAEQRLDAAAVAWLAAGDELGQAARRQHGLAAGAAALAAVAATGELPDDDAAAALALALHDVGVRDEVATWALDDAEAMLTLLLSLAARTVAPYDVPVCTLIGLVAWLRGDGALANVALDRALDGDPSYNMAKLFRAGLDGQLPPSEVRTWLRQTRRSMRPRRRR